MSERTWKNPDGDSEFEQLEQALAEVERQRDEWSEVAAGLAIDLHRNLARLKQAERERDEARDVARALYRGQLEREWSDDTETKAPWIKEGKES